MEVWKQKEKFDGIKLHHVLQRDNKEVDALVNLASSWKDPPLRIFLDILDTPSICLKSELGMAHRGPTPSAS